VGLTRLEIANPEGFQSEYFMRLGSIRVEIPPSALRAETVIIPKLELEDLELALEGSRGGTNYGRILSNLDGPGGGGAKPAGEPEPGGGSGKKFVVKELVVRNVNATLDIDGMGAKLAHTSISLPELRLHDLGAGSNGMQLSELIGQVTDGVVKGVIRKQPELAVLLGGGLETGAKAVREGLERLGGMFQRGD
jgi:hypothetical protein